MKRSSIIEARRMHVNPLIRQNVDLSFQIVDRIHEILVAKGLKQKDLASLLGCEVLTISRLTHWYPLRRLLVPLSYRWYIRKTTPLPMSLSP